MKCKQNKEFADLVSQVSALSKKDYIELWKITRQYRKADRALEKTFIRQKREMMPKKSKYDDNSVESMNYEFA